MENCVSSTAVKKPAHSLLENECFSVESLTYLYSYDYLYINTVIPTEQSGVQKATAMTTLSDSIITVVDNKQTNLLFSLNFFNIRYFTGLIIVYK